MSVCLPCTAWNTAFTTVVHFQYPCYRLLQNVILCNCLEVAYTEQRAAKLASEIYATSDWARKTVSGLVWMYILRRYKDTDESPKRRSPDWRQSGGFVVKLAFYSQMFIFWDLHRKEVSMDFEVHCMFILPTELSLFNYDRVKSGLQSITPLTKNGLTLSTIDQTRYVHWS